MDTTTFETEDGKKELVLHGYNVRYENDEGDLVDYDPSLAKIENKESISGISLDGYIYENKDGDSKQYIPETLTENTPILMEKEGYQISFRPIFNKEEIPMKVEEATKEVIEEQKVEQNTREVTETKDNKKEETVTIAAETIGSDELQEVEVSAETVENIYEEEVSVDNTAIYQIEDKSTELQYVSLENGIKENIVLQECPKNNVFSYEFIVPGLVPEVEEETKQIVLYNRDEIPVGAIDAPNMNDASEDAYSEDITYQIIKKEESEDTYILHMIVNREYLEAEDRVYPVTIDPTVSWTGSSKVTDVYVIKGSPYTDMNFYSSGIVVMNAGKGSKGLYRTYMSFSGLSNTINGKYVESAKLSLYETANSNKGNQVNAYQVKGSWDKSNITYENRAGYYSETILSSFKTAGSAGTEKTLNLTAYARNVANGSTKDYGIIIRANDESSSNTYTEFYNSRHSTTSRRPKLTVVYYDGPTAASSVSLSSTDFKKGTSPTITWSGISSNGLSYIQYRIAKYNSAETTIENTDYTPYSDSTKIGTSGSGSKAITQIASLPEGAYRIYVRGVDKGGIKGSGQGVTFRVDSTCPVISSAKIETSSSSTVYSKSVTPKISWSVSDKHFSSVWYSVDAGANYKQISGAGTSGSYTIPSGIITKPGSYGIFIKVRDKAGNETKKDAGTYYFDNVAPSITKFSIDTLTAETSYTNNGKPVVSWSCTDTTNKVTVAYNINNGSYTNISTSLSGSYQVSALSGKTAGKYVIGFRFTDSAGNVTTKTIDNYYYDPNMPTLSMYKPQNMKVNTNLGYKNRISWDILNGTVLHEQISYNIYRSTSQSFTPSTSNLVAENIHAQYWYDGVGTSGTTYYYKVCAVAKNSSGKVLATSTYSDVAQVENKVSMDYLTKRLGSNSYYTYTSFDTPNGSGMIERSTGNFYYTQMDATLPNQQIDFSLTRYFNSQSKYSGMFGNGWDISLNTQLIKKDGSENLWFKDIDGRLLEFEKNSEGYIQKTGTDYELVKETGSKLELSDEGNTVLKITYEYILTDKSGAKHYFDASGQAICMVATTGKYLQYNYNVNGQLASIVSDSGKKMSFTYAPGTELVSDITLPDETILHYEYQDNNLVKASHLSSKKEIVISYCYSYDSENHLVALMDAEDNQYSLKYDASGRVISAVYPTGDFLELSYDSKQNKTSSKKKSSDGNELYVENVVYDLNTGYVTEVTDALGLVTTYVYENNCLKSQTTDSSYQELDDGTVVWKDYSKTTVYDYDENGNVMTEICSDGAKTEYAYTDKNNENLVTQTTVTNADRIVIQDTTYEYNQDGNLILEKDIIAKTEANSKYTDSDNGSQTIETIESLANKEVVESKAITDENGNTISNNVTTAGTQITQTEQSSYDEMGRIVSSVDQKGRKTEYKYDVLGRETVVIYTSGEKKLREEKSYYPNGQIKQEIAKDGTVTNYTYDALNRLTSKQISKEGITKTWTTSYGYGSVTTSTGKAAETLVQNNVYIEKQLNPEGSVSSVKYTNGKGQVVREQAGGLYSDYVYDRAGKAVVTVLLGQDESDTSSRKVTLSLYDKEGNQIHTIVNPIYEQGVFKIDVDNSILSSTTYDANGNVITSIDGEGNVTTYEYDASGRVTKVILPSKDTQSYQYDSVGEDGIITTKSINALGYKSEVKTDADGRTIETTDVNTKGISIVTKEEYDSEGNKCKTVYSDSSYETYKYDALLRVEEIQIYTEAGKMTGVTKYQYDSSDNVIAMIDYSVSDGKKVPLRYTGYAYDLLGRQIEFYEVDGTDDPTNEEKGKAKISYQYDFEGNLELVIYAGNKAIQSLHYYYNTYNWLDSITVKRADEKEVPVREYTYHNDGKIQQYKEYTDVLGNTGSYELKKYCYDSFGRVTVMSYYNSESKNQCTENHEYTYDKNSNVVSKGITYAYKELTRTQNIKYTYDSKGQLVKSSVETSEGTTLQTTYEYDAVGNRIKMSQSGMITEYTYNSLNQILTSKTTDLTGKVTSNITYNYDVKGNQTEKVDSVTKEKVSYTYDIKNQLTYVVGTNANGSGYTQSNAYNGDGQRISKIDTLTQAGSSTSTTVATNYYYQDGTVLYTTNGSGTMATFNVLGQSGNIMATIRFADKAEYYVYNKDIQGSTSTIIDASGQVGVAYYYDDFGTATELVRDKVENEITYTGAVLDASTGLYYMHARYYNSEIGRFISQDTYRGEKNNARTWHLYAYCANNPINYVDPSGHFAVAIPIIWYTGVKVAEYLLIGTAVSTSGYALYRYQKVRAEVYQSKEKDIPEPTAGPAPDYNKKKKKSPKVKKVRGLSVNKVTGRILPKGKANSITIRYRNGKAVQIRIYGKSGKAYRDIDLTNHGNPKKHPKVPHRHDWDWNQSPPRLKWR